MSLMLGVGDMLNRGKIFTFWGSYSASKCETYSERYKLRFSQSKLYFPWKIPNILRFLSPKFIFSHENNFFLFQRCNWNFEKVQRFRYSWQFKRFQTANCISAKDTSVPFLSPIILVKWFWIKTPVFLFHYNL